MNRTTRDVTPPDENVQSSGVRAPQRVSAQTRHTCRSFNLATRRSKVSDRRHRKIRASQFLYEKLKTKGAKPCTGLPPFRPRHRKHRIGWSVPANRVIFSAMVDLLRLVWCPCDRVVPIPRGV